MTEEETDRILVVEDDPEIRYLLSVVLDADDREIVSVPDGAGAEDVLGRESFDVVLLDLILPDLDGRTLLTRLRSDPVTGTVQVVVISARGDSDIREDCYALGADAFFEKPFDPDELERDVAIRLERSRKRDRDGLTDQVTGLLSRAGLASECAGASGDFAVALVQVDRFATMTEKWGWHAAEDTVRVVGQTIREAVRDDGRVGRLGGGDFAVYTPDPDRSDPVAVAERMLDAVRALTVEGPEGDAVNLTVSIGVVEAEAGSPLDETLLIARRRLFRTHESGRNQVVATDQESEDTPARVLVAEDDEISATILIHRLQKEGLEIVRFDNGRDAYAAALEETPDLVILDIKMPGMDGFEVLERLRRTPAYSEVPIILLTSMGSEADVVRGFHLGADDYVLKPFSPVELSARVWRLLRRGRSESAL